MASAFLVLTLLSLYFAALGQAQQDSSWEESIAEAAKEFLGVPPTTNLFRKYGYPAEGHSAVTQDGYVLRLDRIPRPGQPAVLLGNAMTCNSACYCGLQNDSLAFKIYNAGFDVWLGNFRGTGLSVNHTTLTILDHEFWNFGLHEHGTLDLPAMLEYVVNATGRGSVLYGGHSMAGTAGLITMAQRPQHAKLIQANFFLGPVASLAHHTSPALLVLHALENVTRGVEETLGPSQVPLSNFVTRRLGALFCRTFVPPSEPWTQCPIFSVLGDVTAGQGNIVYPADFADYVPSGASLLEVLHYVQLATPDWPGFRQFNFGLTRNRELYGQDTPPDYEVSKSDLPTYVYYGRTDQYANEENMKLLAKSLANLRKLYQIPEEKFGHLDFVANLAAPAKLYDVVIEDMKQVVSSQKSGGTPLVLQAYTELRDRMNFTRGYEQILKRLAHLRD